MRRTALLYTSGLFLLYYGTLLTAADSDRDFSGKWIFDSGGSHTSVIGAPSENTLTVVQTETTIQCSASNGTGTPRQWSYSLAGKETKYKLGNATGNSLTKWEGAALLINTLVSGPENYSVADRWRLSRNRSVLTIARQVTHGTREDEGTLVYRREGAPVETTGTAPAPPSTPAVVNAPSTPVATASALPARPEAPATPAEIIVVAGTRVPLALRTAIDTRHSREGDRVYLDSVYPVSINGRVIIPRGSSVTGTLTVSKPAGTVKGKGELFIRFDSLTLPNGVTRDFRSRLDSADGTIAGKVDRQEGTINGERDKAGEAKTTAAGAGIGASVGGIAGAAAGSPLAGAGIGAAAGAAAGLASVLVRHRPDVSLPIGTNVEMVLDRDLHFLPADLKF